MVRTADPGQRGGATEAAAGGGAPQREVGKPPVTGEGTPTGCSVPL